jgi:hypothetical protein
VTDETAPEGTIFVCAACGRTNKTRYGFGDSACSLHVVLCVESSLVFEDGLVIKAEAVET